MAYNLSLIHICLVAVAILLFVVQGLARNSALQWSVVGPVSYTHLDVYKRQGLTV